jgi:hypothetical protein
MTRRTRRGLVSLVLIASVSCGGGRQSGPSGSTSSPGSQPATGSATPAPPGAAGQPPAQTGGGQKSQAKPVDVEVLKSLLPELNGWTKVRTRGEQLTTPYIISNARAHYTSDPGTMDIVITDSALNESVFAPFAAFMAAGYEERSADGHRKAAVISGSPGFESWDNGDAHGEVTVIVANRFVVQASGRRVPGIEPVRRAIAAVDLRKLATIK